MDTKTNDRLKLVPWHLHYLHDPNTMQYVSNRGEAAGSTGITHSIKDRIPPSMQRVLHNSLPNYNFDNVLKSFILKQ